MQVASNPQVVHGGPGRDTLDLSAFDIDSAPEPVYTIPPDVEAFVGPGDQIDDLTEQSVPFTVIGNDLGNDIRISSLNITIKGGAGRDRIQGEVNPVDLSEPDPGHDVFYGGGGNDTITGFGSDTIYGDKGNDLITGGGHSVIDGGDGNDTIFGGHGNKLYGGPGDDSIKGGNGNNAIHGGPGNDTLYAGPATNTIDGGDGNDTIFARNGQKDFLNGGSGFDTAQRDNSATIKDQVLNVEKFI